MMKEDDYYNIHRKFQVHSSNSFGGGAKIIIPQWQTPKSTLKFDNRSLPFYKLGR